MVMVSQILVWLTFYCMADIPQGKQECLRYGPSRQDAGATSG
jgi:hypothetical protein